ncbi:hypothetical protein M404DRAFT_24767 [Pisolithus tinctorius Marx 270]|uniref:Uncharacterized protein n=1 Tax=Pisolithus tinctorius Marx 270 TaxID=870435 RepID=A0A0C3PD38_PISTI|nr:hypothetical protein M404DRAFT_24767 [Pisolithus tinctorius Marx 270]
MTSDTMPEKCVRLFLKDAPLIKQLWDLYSASNDEPAVVEEALRVNNKAKARFPERQADLYARASWLIRESIKHGFSGDWLRLRSEWEGICEIQIADFAQETLLTSIDAEAPGENLELFVRTLDRLGMSVVGSPSVEPSREKTTRVVRKFSRSSRLAISTLISVWTTVMMQMRNQWYGNPYANARNGAEQGNRWS